MPTEKEVWEFDPFRSDDYQPKPPSDRETMARALAEAMAGYGFQVTEITRADNSKKWMFRIYTDKEILAGIEVFSPEYVRVTLVTGLQQFVYDNVVIAEAFLHAMFVQNNKPLAMSLPRRKVLGKFVRGKKKAEE
jgi:hypothetical protein